MNLKKKRRLQIIFKSSIVLSIVSIIRASLKSITELLNLRLIYLLIVGSIFAYSFFSIDVNITLAYDEEVAKESVLPSDVNDKCMSMFTNKHHKFLFNTLYTNEWCRKEKNELIKKQHDLNYNQANLMLAGINSPLPEEEEKRSDLFYYILGILILIISAFILRQRYKQYLEEKNKLNQ